VDYNRIQCRAVVLAIMNLQIMLTGTRLDTRKKKDLTKIGCGDCKWTEVAQAPI
jgi:hypothetical protein